MNKIISVVLIGLMLQGCQPIQREPSRATDSKEAPVIYVQTPAVANPDTVSKEDYDKLQERFDTYQRHAGYFGTAMIAVALAAVYFFFVAGTQEQMTAESLRNVEREKDTAQGRWQHYKGEYARLVKDGAIDRRFRTWLQTYVSAETWTNFLNSFNNSLQHNGASQ